MILVLLRLLPTWTSSLSAAFLVDELVEVTALLLLVLLSLFGSGERGSNRRRNPANTLDEPGE